MRGRGKCISCVGSRRFYYKIPFFAKPSLLALSRTLTKLLARFLIKLAQVPIMPMFVVISGDPFSIFGPIATRTLQQRQQNNHKTRVSKAHGCLLHSLSLWPIRVHQERNQLHKIF